MKWLMFQEQLTTVKCKGKKVRTVWDSSKGNKMGEGRGREKGEDYIEVCLIILYSISLLRSYNSSVANLLICGVAGIITIVLQSKIPKIHHPSYFKIPNNRHSSLAILNSKVHHINLVELLLLHYIVTFDNIIQNSPSYGSY